jgi:PAS domain S-box-containing protein
MVTEKDKVSGGSPKIKPSNRGLSDGASKYRALFNAMGVATIAVDTHATILIVNHEFEKLSGYPGRDLEGKKKWTGLLANGDPAKARKYRDFVAGKAHGVSKTLEIQFADSRGVLRNVLVVGKPIANTKDTALTFVDVTGHGFQKSETKLSEEKCRSLIESAEDSIYMIDKDCRYLFVNGKVLARLNTTEKGVVGKRYGDFHDAGDTREFAGYVNKIFETGSSYRYEHKGKKDELYTLRTLSPIIAED